MRLFSARGITVLYDKVAAIENVDLDVEAASVVGLVGHNGAGKSTLLAAIAGVTPAEVGSISLDGKEMTRAEWRRIVRMGVSYVPQVKGVFSDLTVRENLALGLRAGSNLPLDSEAGRARLSFVLSAVPVLEGLLARKAGQLSGGQQGLVSIGRGLIVNPRLLLLDEPSTGLAPIMVNEVLAVIRRLKESGRTSVVLVEQNIPQVLGLADYLYVLKAGAIAASGPPSAFSNLRRIMEYF
jgi:branched-chain amino acid transport system ATP-binding protein